MTAKKDLPQTCFAPARTLRKLLQEQPTPFYLYDAKTLHDACMRLRMAFSWNEGFAPCFPVRMNPNPAVLRVLGEAGARMLCASEAELRLARRAELGGGAIIYAPAAFDEHAANYARRICAAQIVDDMHTLSPQPPAHVFFSVNPGRPLDTDGRTVWNFEKSKLGMKEETIFSLCRGLASGGAQTVGLSVFLRDQETEPLRFYAAMELLFRLAVRIYEELGTRIESLLISGGLGESYRSGERVPELEDVSARVQKSYEEILTPAGLRPKLLLAEGRLLAARAGVLVTRVLAVKQQPTPLVILDADCAQFLREIAFGANHRLKAPLAPESRPKRMVRVAGALCDLRDHFPGTYVLPELKLGECVLVCDAGADGRSFASNYGGSLGCAEFLLENGGARCIRRRQTMEELLDGFSAD